mmetsp:Transcript_1290/g.2808  ORF Transcript_1290/g.2808 Transcript_1290/m.2808 type:complete len:206 (+) Transcript_1290:603-1220(+)
MCFTLTRRSRRSSGFSTSTDASSLCTTISCGHAPATNETTAPITVPLPCTCRTSSSIPRLLPRRFRAILPSSSTHKVPPSCPCWARMSPLLNVCRLKLAQIACIISSHVSPSTPSTCSSTMSSTASATYPPRVSIQSSSDCTLQASPHPAVAKAHPHSLGGGAASSSDAPWGDAASTVSAEQWLLALLQIPNDPLVGSSSPAAFQ